MTLCGQPAAYWAGDRGAANEANPIAHRVIVRGPWPFAAGAAAWLAALSAYILGGRQPYVGWLAALVAFAHAVGGSTRMARWGPLGWALAIVYLIAASQLTMWCWKRAAAESP